MSETSRATPTSKESGRPRPEFQSRSESAPASAQNRDTLHALAATLSLILALSALLLVREPGFFWHCDFQLWFTPIYEDIARAWSHGEWPILSPHSWTTGNLAGEYQCGTFSLFHNAALVAIWKLPLTLPLKAAAFAILYLCVLASGTVLLARGRGLSAGAATLAGLCAAYNGWIISWAASQWFVALAGFAWVPWCWWAFERGADHAAPPPPGASSGHHKAEASRRQSKALPATAAFARWILPALLVYCAVSAGSPFAVLMLGVLCLWLAIKTLSTSRRLSTLGPLVFGLIVGIALAAPSWLALIEYHRFSMRAEWGLAPQWDWIVPWRAWVGLALPSHVTAWRDFYGAMDPHRDIEMAGGLIPLAALLLALFKNPRELWQQHKWELGLLAIAVVLVSIPMFGSFRWSFRNLPLVHLSLALLGATCLDRVKPRAAATTALALLLATALLSGTHQLWPYLIISVAILGVWLLMEFAREAAPQVAAVSSPPTTPRPRQRPTTLARSAQSFLRALPALVTAALLLTTFTHLSTTQKAFVHRFTDNLRSPAPLDPQRLYLGLTSFDDLIQGQLAPAGWGAVLRPANTPLAGGLHFLNGYSSFGARGVPALFEVFGTVRRDTAQTFLTPEMEPLLELLGVDGLVFGPSYAPLTQRLGPEWHLAHDSAEAKVYHREPARAAPAKALAFLDDRPGTQFALPHLRVLEHSRRCLTLQLTPNPASEPPLEGAEDIGLIAESKTVRPVAIAFPRPFYPGYTARLNGLEIPVRAYADLVPLVELPPGASGTLELTYRPAFLRIGSIVALVGVLVLGAVFLALRGRGNSQ